MNIWFLSPHEQPKGHTSRTYDYSQELLKRGHVVSIFTNSYFHRTHEELLEPREQFRIDMVDGLRVIWLRTMHYTGNGWRRGFNMISFARQALRVARGLDDRPDVVVGDSVPPAAGWTAAQLARRHDAAFVYQIRDVWPIALVYDGGLPRHSPVYYAFRHVEKQLYRRADRICSTVPFLADHVRSSGADSGKIVWIPNGVNLDRYPGTEQYDGGRNRQLVAMYVGAFGVAHDVISIVRAADILQQRGVHGIRFVIVGDGVKRAECEAEARRHGLSNMEFRNSVPKAEVPMLQRAADLFIACVTDSQAYQFGLNLNKLYDYFASGRAVIFSGKAPADPVTESGAGYVVPPEQPARMADALEQFVGLPPEQRIALGRRARDYAEKYFHVPLLAGQMEAMFAGAVADRRSRR